MMTARFCLVKMTAGLFKSPGGHFFFFFFDFIAVRANRTARSKCTPAGTE